MKKKATDFPEFVYVREEEDGDEPYLLVDREFTGEHGVKVGVYRLEWIKTIRHTVTLE